MTSNPPPRGRLLVLTSTFPRRLDDRSPPFVLELCRRLSEEFDIWVLAPHGPGALAHERWDGIEIIRFRYFFTAWERLGGGGGILANLKHRPLLALLVPFFMLSQLLGTLNLLRKQRITLIHAHWFIPQGLTAILARMLSPSRVAVLCTAHGSDLTALRGKPFALLQRFIAQRADAITVVSESLRRRLLEIAPPPGRLSVMPMGIDARHRFTPEPETTRNENEILFVGRLAPEKGLDTLIKAFQPIAGQQPLSILTIVGQGPLEAGLRDLCGKLGIALQVRFEGAVANEGLPAYYRRAALFVLPSVSEGFGLACAEAMASECPVVVSDIPALRELVHDRETGLSFPVRDEQGLGARIRELLADAPLRARLGRQGREYVLRRHDWQCVGAGYRSLLHGLGADTNGERPS